MSWPLSHEFNEAVQNPSVVFSDPDLKGGETVVGATGLPLPRSGNFADVYQLRGADGREWAVKCFTRPVTGLAERYAHVSAALAKADLPFGVRFTFLAEGIRVGGAWRPVVKMEWVEGLLLNQILRENAGSAKVLSALGQMWVKLCKRLREVSIAHADLQHGNVMLVPGSRAGAYGLKLIDYDGMWVPALANTPSGEVGHPSYQHPMRAANRTYSPDVDRFPHLVVATALRGLLVGGPSLWEKYDNGDNLLFTETDYKNPSGSAVMKELWQTGDAAVQALVGRLAIMCGKPIPQTPWLDQFAPEGDPTPLDDATRRRAADALGIALPVPVPLPPEPAVEAAPGPGFTVELELEPPPEPVPPAVESAFVYEEEVVVRRAEDRPAKQSKRQERRGYQDAQPARGRTLLLVGGGLVLLIGGIVAGVMIAGGNKNSPETVQKKVDEPKDAGPKDTGPQDTGPQDTGAKEPVEGPKPKDKGAAVVPKPKDKGTDPVIPKPKDTGSAPVTPVPPVLGTITPTARDLKWKVDLPNSDFLGSPVVSRDGRTVAIPHTAKGEVVILDTETGERLASPPDHFDGTGRVVPLDGGRFAPGVLRGDTVPVWDPREGKVVQNLPAAGLAPGGLVFVSPTGKYLAVTTNAPDGKDTLTVKSTSPEKEILNLKWQRGAVHFTDDESKVLVADSAAGRCRWYALPLGSLINGWVVNKQAISWAPDSGVKAVSGDGSMMSTWALTEDKKKAIFLLGGNGQLHGSAPVLDLLQVPSFSRDGQRVLHQVPGPEHDWLIVYEPISARRVAEYTPPSGFRRLRPVLLPDGRAYVAVVANGDRRAVVRCEIDPPAVAAKPPDPVPLAPKLPDPVILGHQTDPAFKDLAPAGGHLIGLEIGLGKFGTNDVVHALRPLYRTGDKETKGERHGPNLARVTVVKAKNGYAVGTVTVKAGAGLDGMSVTFMKVVDGKLDPSDAYESDWVGGKGGNPPVKLGGDGSPVVGIVGRTNKNGTNGFGVLLKGQETFEVGGAAAAPPPPAPGELTLRWSVPVKEKPRGGARFDRDGQTVAVVYGDVPWSVEALNTRDGKPVRELPNLKGNYYSPLPMDKGKFAYWSDFGREIVVWDPATGKSVSRQYPQAGGATPSVSVAPNGRYALFGARDPGRGEIPETQFRVIDLTTGAELFSKTWRVGSALFTSDSARVLVVDDTATFRWFKLPRGEPDGSWSFDLKSNGFNGRTVSVSGNGALVLYEGAPPGKEQTYHLLNGKTGEIIHSLPAKRYVYHGSASDDGQFVALIRNDGFGTGHSVEVVNRRGEVVASVLVPGAGQPGAVYISFGWKGQSLLIAGRDAQKLNVYELGVPAPK